MSNAGQLWSAKSQWGLETTAGTPVAATRIMYFREPTLTIERDARVHRFATGTRDNVRAYTNGPTAAGGAAVMPLSADEIIEFLEIGVQGAVTATTPSGATLARLWTFKPGGSLDSATIEWDDGARVWQGAGYRANSITLAGGANEENLVTADLFGTDVIAGSLTGSLSERVPDFVEGWQTRMYIDAFTGTPGTTPIPGVLRNWSVQIQNNLARLYTADNTLAARRVVSGELDITASLTFDAYPTQALTEFNDWIAATKRLVRLEFLGPADGIETGVNEVQTITVTGSPTSGTFITLVLGQNVTLNWDDTAAEVQTAINAALATLGTGHTVAVTGSGFPANAATVTFSGAQVSGRDIPLMSLVTNSLAGGSSPTVAYATTTPGRSGRRYVIVDLPGAWTAINIGGSADGIRTYEMSFQSVYQSTLATMMQVLVQNNRTSAF